MSFGCTLAARFTSAAALLLTGVALLSCGGSSDSTGPPSVKIGSLELSPPSTTLVVAQSIQLTATIRDEDGNIVADRTPRWQSTSPNVATVSDSGVATAVAVGTTRISALTGGKSDTAQITVQACPSTLVLALGEVHLMSGDERSLLCLDGSTVGTEYSLVSFNHSTVASTTTPVTIVASNTVPAVEPLASRRALTAEGLRTQPGAVVAQAVEEQFRERERRDVAAVFSRDRRARPAQVPGGPPSYLIGVPPLPTVGSIVQLNTNLTGNTCTDAPQLHGARVVSVLPHTIVLTDTLSPAGGYTDDELTAFGEAFDTLGFALDTINFGSPTDIDGNGRIAILFTPGVNVIPAPAGAFIGGLEASRDLAPLATCSATNLGEMFYMPVPDPTATINSNYTLKTNLANVVLPTLVHEFQHLINAGRRIYVNNASSFEEVWLNEGLSHIAEELLYIRVSGNGFRDDIDLARVQSSPAQLNAANMYILQNFERLKAYMQAPETNSPYAPVDGLAMRGAIWQFLRYCKDRSQEYEERNVWYPLVNSTTTGQQNFNAVFGDITQLAHDWSIAQIADDPDLGIGLIYRNPSYNFQSLLPPLNGGSFPLLIHDPSAAPVNVTLNGGGSAYLRFRLPANKVAIIAATSSGQPISSLVDFTLIRTQ